jgi:hypothetical protein
MTMKFKVVEKKTTPFQPNRMPDSTFIAVSQLVSCTLPNAHSKVTSKDSLKNFLLALESRSIGDIWTPLYQYLNWEMPSSKVR